ncbi:MAG: Calx-beta domain-containing protein [Pirellulales bacterium]
MQELKNPPLLKRLYYFSWAKLPKARRTSGYSSRRLLQAEPLECRALLSATADFQVVNDWGSGFQGEINLINDGNAISDWKLEFDFSKQITQIWNAVIVSQTGTHFVIGNDSWNRSIAPGASVNFGFLGTSGNVTTTPENFVLNGALLGDVPDLPSLSIGNVAVIEGDLDVVASFVVTLSETSDQAVTVNYATSNGSAQAGLDYVSTSGALTFQPGETTKSIPVTIRGDLLDEAIEDLFLTLSGPNGTTLDSSNSARAVISDNDPAPQITISDAAALEPQGGATAAGYFHTSGSQILDTANQPVRIAGVNWFGMESDTFAPHGLWTRGYRSTMDQMKAEGFNAIRLPYSNQAFDAGSTPNGIDFSQNADLQGLNALGILDKIVDYAQQIGLRIILDHHRSAAGAGAEGSGLWYTGAYPESRWIEDWKMLAARYAGNPTVIGADLHNEPHGPAGWGSGSANDWRLAAERAGNAILAVNPAWLILVEGVESGSSGSYWWGGNLSNARDYPVRLNVPGRLVYSPHDYPASVYPQSWFSAANYPNNLPDVWDRNWGYLFREDIAPIMLGEFGSKLATASDQLWFDAIAEYLNGDLNGDGQSDLAGSQLGPSWTYWSWNPNSGDTGGILQDDWRTVHRNKVETLEPIQFELADVAATQSAEFTVSLSAPSGKPVTVSYSTSNGTATAGADYTASAGTLTFAPGETRKILSIAVLADSLTEGDETFGVRLASAQNGTLVDAQGTGTIADRGGPTQLPTLSIADVTVTEGDAQANEAVFTVSLSGAANQTVTVNYATLGETAQPGEDFLAASGVLSFAPGMTSLTVVVPIVGDTRAESSETLRVVLSNPTGATLTKALGTATILDNDIPATGVTANFAVSDDWGSGFVAGITITNHAATNVDDWTIEFDFDRQITNIWNATIVSHVGDHYVIRAASWNRKISKNGGTVSFGFQGATGDVEEGPTNLVFNGVPIL